MPYDWLTSAISQVGAIPLREVLCTKGIRIEPTDFEQNSELNIETGLGALRQSTGQDPAIIQEVDIRTGERTWRIYSAQRAYRIHETYKRKLADKLAEGGITIPEHITREGLCGDTTIDTLLTSFADATSEPIVVLKRHGIGPLGEQKQYVAYTQKRARILLGESDTEFHFDEEGQVPNTLVHTPEDGNPARKKADPVRRTYKLYQI